MRREKMNPNFMDSFERKVEDTIKKYNLLNKKEKIIVAASGGKDSTTILYLLHKFGFNVEALHINLCLGTYSKKCLSQLKKFCQDRKIKLHIIDIRKKFGSSMCYIRSNIQNKIKITNCMACGIIKKWILNKEARKLKADKIVTGHNLDDETQTILINFMKGNPSLSITLGPRTGIIEDKKFVPRVKPLYFSAEEDIRNYSLIMKLPVNYEKCPCAISSFRIETRKFLNQQNKETKENIVKTFLEILPELKNLFFKEKNILHCKKCGEPSRNEICKTCKLLS